MEKKRNRIASLDVLRMILAVMVIILHFNNSNGGKAFIFAATNHGVYDFLLAMEALSICAVNCFVMLSGFFLCTNQKRYVKKPILLIGTVVCYNVLFYGIEMIITQNFSVVLLLKQSLPINYYVWLYSTLYLISPYINICLNQLDKRKFQFFCIILTCLFIIWPTIVGMYTGMTGTVIQQISTISSVDHGSGYTIIQFIVMYIFGAYIRKYSINLSGKFCLLIYLMSSMVVYVLMHLSMAALEYCNLFVVLASFGLVVFFVKRKIKESAFVSKLASVSFNVFLVHGFLMPYLKYFPLDYFLREGTLLQAMIASVIVVLILYMASIAISITSKFVMNPIIGIISKFLYWEFSV